MIARLKRSGQRCLKCGWAPSTDLAALIELEAVVVEQLTDLIEAAGPVPVLAGQANEAATRTPVAPAPPALRQFSPR